MAGCVVTVTPMTPAERKRAQRQRDRATLFAPGASLDTMPTSGLLDALPRLLGGDRPGTLGEVLRELGRRGGVTVTARPAPLGAGSRVKA